MTRTRHSSTRWYEPGTVFREADGLWVVQVCRASDPDDSWETRVGMKFWDIDLEKMTPEEEMLFEVHMS